MNTRAACIGNVVVLASIALIICHQSSTTLSLKSLDLPAHRALELRHGRHTYGAADDTDAGEANTAMMRDVGQAHTRASVTRCTCLHDDGEDEEVPRRPPRRRRRPRRATPRPPGSRSRARTSSHSAPGTGGARDRLRFGSMAS